MADEPTPDSARRFVKTLADLYGDAVVALLRTIAARVDAGLDTTTQRAKLDDVLALRREAGAVAASVADLLDDTLAAILSDAYEHGVQQGSTNLADVLGVRDMTAERAATTGLVATKASTVEALAGALGEQLRHLPIVRATEDAYRAVIAQAIAPASAGVETRRQAAQRALDRLAMHGIRGFTDRSGRQWRLESYVEMATRSTLGQASLQGSLDRIGRTTPFVRVSDVADECELCRPWEGRILLADDTAEVPDRWAGVRTSGTVRDARSAGLFHPNCTHSVGAYIPGLTRADTARPARANAAGYEARQRQRALERHVREWKRREAVAINPQARATAQAKVQRWQQALVEHVEATNRLRLRAREQVTRAR